MNDYTKLLANYATYFPASPPGAAEFPVSAPKLNERLPPAGLTKADFNFFNPSSALFQYERALMSAGLALGPTSNKIPNEMITDRKNRLPTSLVLWDSGGYQLIRDKIRWQGDLTRKLILEACEYFADGAITLDIPPLGLSKQFPTYEVCRDTTVESLRYYTKHRKSGEKLVLLNCLQGCDRDQCDDWYAHVRPYQTEGWAFASLYKKDFSELLRRTVILCDDNMMDGRVWLHVLGTNRLAFACALTTIQTVLSRELGRFIRVSYDTSSPFTCAYRSRMTYLGYAVDKSGLAMRQCRFPNSDTSSDWEQLPYPTCFPSTLSNRLKLSDICLPGKSIFAPSSWDNMSYHLIANHNLEVLLNAILGAHRIYMLDDNNAAGLCPDWLIRTKIGIEEVLTSSTPMTAIDKYADDFEMVRSGGRCLSADGLFEDEYDDYDDANRG